jgi:hypothetical protein
VVESCQCCPKTVPKGIVAVEGAGKTAKATDPAATTMEREALQRTIAVVALAVVEAEAVAG